MDPALKHRLIGAAVLSAIAIIFLPMLMVGRDVNDTASSVPLNVPKPPSGDFQTKELPLVAPSPGVPANGVVGMDTSHPPAPASVASPASAAIDADSPGSPPADVAASTAAPAAVASSAASGPAAASPAASPAASGKTAASPAASPATPGPGAASPAVVAAPSAASPAASVASPAKPGVPIPAANAGGHYVVSLGIYSNAANAQSLVASLQAKQLPAYAEAITSNGKPATRVRLGPFQQRGDAEAARLRAQQVRSDMPASVTALDAAVAAPAPTPAPAVPPQGKSPAASGKAAATPAGVAVASGKAATAASPGDGGKNKPPVTPSSGPAGLSAASVGHGYVVQVSAFRVESEALTLRNKLRAAGFTAFSEKVQADSGTLFRVRIGPEASRDDADHLRTELSAKLGLSGMVVAYP